jgi:phosphatidylserine synthase 2
VAHALGWWGKMVMFRDWGVCWLLSVGFEILECSLQFIIPEFKECWWDSLLIDLLGANLLGMAAGWVTLQVHRKKGEEA